MKEVIKNVLTDYFEFFSKMNMLKTIAFSNISIKNKLRIGIPRRFLIDKKDIKQRDMEREIFIKKQFKIFLEKKYGLKNVENCFKKYFKLLKISFPRSNNIYSLILNYFMLNAVFLEDCYSKNVRTMEHYIVFDLGANVGLFSLLTSLKTKNKIYAFEPSKLNYHYLKNNIKNFGAKNIIPINKGIAEKSSKREFYIGSENHAAYSFCKERGNNLGSYKKETVGLVSVDDFVRKMGLKKVDLIKTNIEGYELKFIEGAKETIKRFKPKMIISAYHNVGDKVKISKAVMQIRDDYKFKKQNWEGELDLVFW